MTLTEFLGNVGLILAVMGVLSLVELAIPLFARGERARGRARANLGLSALTLALNWLLISASAIAALRFGLGAGALARSALPFPMQVAATVVILDLCTYAAHRGMHAIPGLWHVHSVHHGDDFLDVTTTLRQHPLEGLWRFAWLLIPTWLLGLPAAGVVVYRLMSVVQGLFEHANIRVWGPLDRAVSLAWVTPNFHKLHHSRVREETDSNFGNLLALFDRGFGTWKPGTRASEAVYGLDEVEPATARSLAALLALPWSAVGSRDGAFAQRRADLGRSE